MSDDCLQLKFRNTAVNLKYKPFKLDILVDDKVVTTVNSRGLLNFEHYRRKPRYTRLEILLVILNLLIINIVAINLSPLFQSPMSLPSLFTGITTVPSLSKLLVTMCYHSQDYHHHGHPPSITTTSITIIKKTSTIGYHLHHHHVKYHHHHHI